MGSGPLRNFARDPSAALAILAQMWSGLAAPNQGQQSVAGPGADVGQPSRTRHLRPTPVRAHTRPAVCASRQFERALRTVLLGPAVPIGPSCRRAHVHAGTHQPHSVSRRASSRPANSAAAAARRSSRAGHPPAAPPHARAAARRTACEQTPPRPCTSGSARAGRAL